MAKSAGSRREAFPRVPRLAPTNIWKKSVSALVSDDRKGAARPVPALASATQVISTSTSAKFDAPEKLDWSEGAQQVLFSPGDIMDGQGENG